MARKLTSEKLAEIARLRALDWSRDDIAKAVNLSGGSVSAAYKQLDAQAKGEPQAASPEPAGEPVEPPDEPMLEAPTIDSQLAWLGSIVRQRKGDADRMRAAGDNVGAARATRDAIAASSLLARHSPKPETDGVVVTADAIRAAAEKARTLLDRLVERAIERARAAGESP